ncbi:transposase, partial [Streptomyces scabiei]|uniref:transposase n=1 Tax=Streptomyces scabiei TaxID=1930 RepID=UPI0038F74EC1
RLLLRGREHLTDRQAARLHTALAAGDPNGEVELAWQVAQAVRAVYHTEHLAQGRRRAEQLLDTLHTCPIPEVARL